MAAVVSPTIGGIGIVTTTATGARLNINYTSGIYTFTPDGTQVALAAPSPIIAPDYADPLPGVTSLWLKDLYTGAVKPAFLTSTGTLPSDPLFNVAFTPDGTTMAGITRSSTLFPGYDPTLKLVVVDLRTGSYVRAEDAADGTRPDREIAEFAISANGQRIVISTSAQNIATGLPWDTQQVFVKDVSGGTYQLVSSNAAGEGGNQPSNNGIFSRDGQFVAFSSTATNLVAGDTNAATYAATPSYTNTYGRDVFVKNLATGEVTRISTASDGSELALINAEHPIFSADGTRVLFEMRQHSSLSDRLGTYHLMEKNLVTGELIDVFAAAGAVIPNGYYDFLERQGVSDDFSKILFWTFGSTNLPNYEPLVPQAYILDRATGTISHVITDLQGAVLSGDGTTVVAMSDKSQGFAEDPDFANYDLFAITVAPATVAVDDTATAVEDGAAVTIDVLANDLTATAGSAKTLIGLDVSRLTGTASMVDGKVVYDPGVNFQSLKAGQTTTTAFDYTMRDAEGAIRTGTVTLTIQGTNDIPALTVRVSVPENTETPVYGVDAVDPDGDPLTLRLSGPDASRFTLDTTTGDLSFNLPPDFEAPADAGADNTYNVTITVSDGIQPISQNLAIRVTNLIYENAPPVFTSGTTGTIAENATGIVYTATAIDDGDAAGLRPVTLVYGITGHDAPRFTIDSATGALSFTGPKDFEAPDSAGGTNVYEVTVTASDGSRTARQAVSITVTDVYENTAPAFTSGDGASFAENGTGTVYTAVATDNGDAAGPVTGSLAYLTLSLASGGTNDNAFFTLDPATGALTFVTPPDFENPADGNGDNVYHVVLQVTDGPDFTVTKDVFVTVTDVYENTAPVVTDLSPATFEENGTGAAFAISASDNGGPSSAGAVTITYSIGGADAALFSMNAATGVATFIAAPDFENPLDADGDNVYEVTLTASDGGLSTSINRSLAVTDVNVAPVVSSPASASFAENGTGVAYAITYTDDDDLAGGRHAFSLSGDDAALFTLDSATGEIRFIDSPNFEAPRSNAYRITVSVADIIDVAGVPELIESSQDLDVVITVTNVNEGLSITSGGTVAFTENLTTPAYLVTALDIDANPSLTYGLSGIDAARFTINASTGVVSFVAAPDFETPLDAGANNVYDIVVSATDGEFTASRAVAITIGNVIEGTGAGDTVNGTGSADTMDGGLGNDSLNGSGGDDTMIGGAGTFNDSLNGGAGADSMVGGGGNDQLTGGLGNDTLQGDEGNDRLDGGGGADSLVGGTGNDSYFADNALDEVLERAGEGTDIVYASASYTLSAFVESLTLMGTTSIDGTGNAENNTLTGNAGNNRLEGAEGHDSLDGGAGADVLVGGQGNDVFTIDHAGDSVIEEEGEGVDQVRSTVTVTLSDFVENLLLTGTAAVDGTGNDLDNTLTGNAGNNVLAGAQGHDTINGAAGIDTIDGGDGNDSLVGGADGDSLAGGAGHDRLDGGTGADSMAGGAGNDTYVVDAALDLVTELAGEGTDLVQAGVSYTLTAGVENLTLAGGTSINGTGNALANAITGNGGDNELRGLQGDDVLVSAGGADTLNGGEGADTLSGGSGNDVFQFGSAAEGGDRITDYRVADDTIRVSASGFGGGLVAGMDVAASGFYAANNAGAATSATNAQFVFDLDDGLLYWDANGTAPDGRVLIAALPSVAGFTGAEIQVIA
jgi:Ca2+-binding RTX toxin-like protein